MITLPLRRVVLYKHGVGYFEREGKAIGDNILTLTFKKDEVSDVLKSLTTLDLDGGRITSVSYDSTKPLEQLLAEVAIDIPDRESLVGLLPQIKGARIALHTGVADPVEGALVGIDTSERHIGDGVVKVVLVSVLTDSGAVRSFDLHGLASLQILDDVLRRDLDYYLRTRLSATKKDARTFTFFAEGEGDRRIRLSYTLEAPVWKATYRILLGNDDEPCFIQGWAVVDNTQDEDWEDVQLSLISGLPVSFVHDLYTPRYIQRPEVKVKDTTGVLPPEMEEGYEMDLEESGAFDTVMGEAAAPAPRALAMRMAKQHHFVEDIHEVHADELKSSVPTQVREQVLGDLLEYQIEHPVTIRRNQSALAPIVGKDFDGKPVLLYNKNYRAENPMSAVLFQNTTGLTLEGGPVTVLQEGSYVGEAMLDTIKPDEERIVPFAVELSVAVTDSINTRRDRVHRVIVKNGVLTTYRAEIATTTYTMKNKADREYTLYLEHSRQPDDSRPGNEWELASEPAPVETTENFWRFKLTLPGKNQTAFTVTQRLLVYREHSLFDLAVKSLESWVRQRYFDEATERVLLEVVNLREEEAAIAERITLAEKERNDIFSSQKRVRENLNSLGDRPSEKELRERFVSNLNKQEDRLEEIDAEVKERNKALVDCREKIKGVLGRLEYDGAVEGK